MAFSAGFTPHPKISYANAAPTGHGERGRVLRDLGHRPRSTPTACGTRWTRRCRPGWTCCEVVEAAPGALADRLQASDWGMEFRGLPLDRLEAGCAGAAGRATSSRSADDEERPADLRRSRGPPSCRSDGCRAVVADGSVCDTADGRTAHHTGRTPRRRSHRAARSGRPRAADTTPGDSAGAGAAADRNRRRWPIRWPPTRTPTASERKVTRLAARAARDVARRLPSRSRPAGRRLQPRTMRAMGAHRAQVWSRPVDDGRSLMASNDETTDLFTTTGPTGEGSRGTATGRGDSGPNGQASQAGQRHAMPAPRTGEPPPLPSRHRPRRRPASGRPARPPPRAPRRPTTTPRR